MREEKKRKEEGKEGKKVKKKKGWGLGGKERTIG
jgi:hypothetical protein